MDPVSHVVRNYYPDFFVRTTEDKVELIEVKGDNKIDDATVRAKSAAAKDIADASEIEYGIIAGNFIMEYDVSRMTLAEAQRRPLAEARGEDNPSQIRIDDEREDQ